MSLEQSLRDIMHANNLRAIDLRVNEWSDLPEVQVFWTDASAEHGCRLVCASGETYAAALADGIRKANAVRFPAIELPSDALVLEGGAA